MKLNLDFTGATLLKDWWKTVKGNFEAIQSHSTDAVIDHPDKSVTTEKIADYAVKTMKLANESVSAGKIATDAVHTTHLKDGNVTRSKLSGDVQTQLYNFQTHIDNPSQEIAYRSVTKDKLSHEITSDLEKTLSTAEFINTLYGCRVFLWTKNEMICPDDNFPNEFEVYENDKAVDEDFADNVWYLYKHDGTFLVDSFTYIGYDVTTYYGLNHPFGAEGMYALRFNTIPAAQGTGYSSGTCEAIKLASENFEDMIAPADAELSDTSTRPVQNKVVKAELDKKFEVSEVFEGFLDFLFKSNDYDAAYSGVMYIGDVYTDNLVFTNPPNGFRNMSEVTQAILDIQDRVSALEG